MRSISQAAPRHTGPSTAMTSTNCSGNHNWASHSSALSHQLASPSNTSHSVRAGESRYVAGMFAVYAQEPNQDKPLDALVIGERPEPDVPQGWVKVSVKA